jgi:hypothetical protein
MEMMVRLRTARRIAWLLASAIAIPYLSIPAMAAPKAATPVRSVVMFPLETAEGIGNAQLGAELNTALKDALSSYHGYRVVVYTDKLPAVQRLVAMQPDKKSLTTGPFSEDEAAVSRAVTLGKAMLADLIVVGSADKYVFNDKDGTADLTLSLQVFDGATGKSVQTVAVTGRGVGVPQRMEGVSQAVVQRDAIRDTVRKTMKAMTGEEYLEPRQGQSPVIESKKRSKASWIPMLLLSIGVGVLLGGSGGHGSGTSGTDSGGTENPPPPPL